MRQTSAVTAGIVAAALAAQFLAAPGESEALHPPACPAVIAHKAGGDYAPENTLGGIVASGDQGATVVELDVRWSKGNGTAGYPGWPVLMHDATVDRTTPYSGPVDQIGLTTLLSYPAADYAPWAGDPQWGGERIPYAWDFLSAGRDAGLTMLLDVKVTPDQHAAAKLVEYLDRTGTRDDVIYMGSAANVSQMHAWYPDLRYSTIEYPPAGRIATGEAVLGTGADTLALPWQWITAPLVGYYHAYGLRVYSWTSDRPVWDVAARWQHLAAHGVDAIITNRPAAALAALGCGE